MEEYNPTISSSIQDIETIGISKRYIKINGLDFIPLPDF
jgi:hypothetical protein